MAEAYPALASLRKMLIAERQRHLEIMADGRTEEKHYELVGRCKGLAWAIEKVSEQIKSINGESDGDEQSN